MSAPETPISSKAIRVVVTDEAPKGTLTFITPASDEQIRQGTAVYVPGVGYLNPRGCAVIKDIG